MITSSFDICGFKKNSSLLQHWLEENVCKNLNLLENFFDVALIKLNILKSTTTVMGTIRGSKCPIFWKQIFLYIFFNGLNCWKLNFQRFKVIKNNYAKMLVIKIQDTSTICTVVKGRCNFAWNQLEILPIPKIIFVEKKKNPREESKLPWIHG